ncbi:ANTAR domain-containing protein [Cellulomonas sp. Marseille-Q8402]
MSRSTPMSALATTLSALAAEQDALSVLTTLVGACASALTADVGIVVSEDLHATEPERFDLLAASSHTAGSLELYQLQVGSGPCLDSVAMDADVSVVGDAAMGARWPRLQPALLRSGYHAAHALPMRWRGRPFGALNLFLSTPHPLTGEERTTARGFADIAAVTIVHADDSPDLDAIARAISATASHRALVEQAKGAVRYLMDLDEGEAFALLQRRAHLTATPITAVAGEVVTAAAAGERLDWLRRW